jgi:excisionase family DNA binding protein
VLLKAIFALPMTPADAGSDDTSNSVSPGPFVLRARLGACMPKLTALYRVDEAAHLLALKPLTVRKLIAQGHIAVCRPSPRSVRVPEAEIIRLQRLKPTMSPTSGARG